MLQPIIDTHVHIWDLSQARYDWLAGDTSILHQNYTLDMLEPERAKTNVVAGVLVQAAGNKEDTELMLAAARKAGWIKGVVGWLPLQDPKAVAQLLENEYASEPYFKGVRHQIHDEADAEWLLQDEVIESLKIVAAQGLPYDLVGILPVHIKTAMAVARKVPELRMVFNHLNQPPIAKGEQFGIWGKWMQEAAAFPQLYAKISGLGSPAGAGDQWNEAMVLPYVDFILKAFGEDRCFCGGDWPVSLLTGSYAHAWEVYENVLQQLLAPAAVQKILFDNAVKFYGLTF